MASQPVNLDAAIQQIIQLGDAVAQLRNRVGTLEGDHLELRRQLREGRSGTATRDFHGKSELRSLKAAYPDKFQPKADCFKSWTEDFERWMEAESAEATQLLKEAKGSKMCLRESSKGRSHHTVLFMNCFGDFGSSSSSSCH